MRKHEARKVIEGIVTEAESETVSVLLMVHVKETQAHVEREHVYFRTPLEISLRAFMGYPGLFQHSYICLYIIFH